MDQDAQKVIDETADLLRRIYGGRAWITAEPELDAALGGAKRLQRLGATVFALGAGAASMPEDESIPYVQLGVQTKGMIRNLRVGEAALDAVPDEVRATIEAWDPSGAARVVRALFSDGAPVAGRAAFGARPAAWRRFDDKTVIDALWDDVGIPRAPSQVVDATPEALAEAHAALDAGEGTVWAIDNREGWNGAASGLRWVHDAPTHEAAVAFAEASARRVRVMPFLEGQPCSIHGIVFPDHVLVLRPCEMVILRDPVAGRFHYATAASTWDPQPEGRATLRALARRVGETLRRTENYRGAFTLDGVYTRDGFRPTELNPRFGAALGMLGSTVPEIDLYLLQLALVEGRDVAWAPQRLEAALVAAADATRRTGSTLWLPGDHVERRTADLVADGTTWRDAREGEAPQVLVGTRTMGPGPILRIVVETDFVPPGEPVAPIVAAVARALNSRWSLGLPDLQAAPTVH